MSNDGTGGDTKKSGDFIIPGPRLEDGNQMVIRHRADHTCEVAKMIPVEDGKPLPPGSEIVNITGDGPVYDVESLYKLEGESRKGPAKVSSEKYRSGWDEIFG